MGRFLSVDPLAADYAGWSGYGYVLGNPLMFVDPDGKEPDWIENGDGTYTAEDGDSASSLAMDAGISFDKANKLVEGQLGPNYEGIDGELKSNVKKGDLVDINPSAGFVSKFSNYIEKGDGFLTFTGGLGLNSKEVNRWGNSGSRFRASLFGSNIRLSGNIGSSFASVVKYGGPVLTLASVALTLNSNQSASWKVADIGASGLGLLGGPYGAAASVGYSFLVSVRPAASFPPQSTALPLHRTKKVKRCEEQQSKCFRRSRPSISM